MFFRIPTWIWNDSELSPNGEKLVDVLNQADYPVKFDSRLRFRVYLLPGEVLKLIDELPSSVAKSANIKLFEEGATGTLGVNIDNLKKSWENIQKIEIRVGTERYRPYMHDTFMANPVSGIIKIKNKNL